MTGLPWHILGSMRIRSSKSGFLSFNYSWLHFRGKSLDRGGAYCTGTSSFKILVPSTSRRPLRTLALGMK